MNMGNSIIDFNEKKGFICDMDGVIYHGNQILPGIPEFIQWLHDEKNWWGDMPMPLYTFLEEYDFSGKTIIPFTAHGGSGFSDTVNTIGELQPEAEVSEEGLSISRNDVADAEEEIRAWVCDRAFSADKKAGQVREKY